MESTQRAVDGIGVLKGANLEWNEPVFLPCSDCGEPVDLSSIIIVEIVDHDGSESSKEMTEANARVLLYTMDIAPPPVMCIKHAHLTIEPELEGQL